MSQSTLRVMTKLKPLLAFPTRRLVPLVAVRSSVTSAPRAAAKNASFNEATEKSIPKQSQGGNEKEVTWMWQASREQMMMAEGHQHGTRWTVVAWRLSTLFSLNHSFFDSVVEILTHKLGPLRGVMQFRLGKPWVCESLAPHRDVQFLDENHETVQKEVASLCNTEMAYTRTPLWRLLVVPAAKVSFSPFCSLYSQEYDIYFRFHHAFMDQRSMAFCLGCFANVIHQASIGDYVEAKGQLGVHVSGNEGNSLRDAVKKFLISDVDALEFKKSSIRSISKVPYILEAFSPPGGTPSSKHVHRFLVPGAFKRFTDLCAKSEVTVSTALKAAINTGLVELVKEAGIKQEIYKIGVTWNCDLRRFIPPYQMDMLGFHQTPVVHLMPTPSSVYEIFWTYAKKMNESLHLFYMSGEDFQQHILAELMEDIVSPEDYFKQKPFPVLDYAFINGGNLSSMIRAHSDQFSLSDVYMMSSAHKSHYVVCHQMNMYNGAFFYTLSYDTSYVTEVTANVLSDKVLSVIETA